MSTLADTLVRLSIQPDPSEGELVARLLRGVDPDDLELAGWQALLAIESRLDLAPPWSVRVAGLRRRSHAGVAVGADAAARLSASLQSVGVAHAVHGDLAVAVAYGQPPGSRVVGTVIAWVDPTVDEGELRSLVANTVELDGTTGPVVRGRAHGLPVALLRGWSSWLCADPLRHDIPKTRSVERPSGGFPVLSPAFEAYRQLAYRGHPHFGAWLLDLATVTAGRADVWSDVAALAARGERRITIRRSWRLAHEAGVAPPPPTLGRDRPREALRQGARRLSAARRDVLPR